MLVVIHLSKVKMVVAVTQVLITQAVAAVAVVPVEATDQP
jgi:hypothetical protein